MRYGQATAIGALVSLLAQIVSVTHTPEQPIPQELVHTEAERIAIHRRLMRGAFPGLIPRVRREQDRLAHIVATGPVFVRSDYVSQPNAERELQMFFCDTVVAIGRFGPASLMTTDDDSEIFTTREFKADEIILNNTLAPLKAGQSVTVIHPGGTVVVDGRRVSSYGPTVSHLPHLVMFETFIPATGAYKTELLAVEIRADAVEVVNHQHFQHADKLGPTAFKAAARKAGAALPEACRQVRSR